MLLSMGVGSGLYNVFPWDIPIQEVLWQIGWPRESNILVLLFPGIMWDFYTLIYLIHREQSYACPFYNDKMKKQELANVKSLAYGWLFRCQLVKLVLSQSNVNLLSLTTEVPKMPSKIKVIRKRQMAEYIKCTAYMISKDFNLQQCRNVTWTIPPIKTTKNARYGTFLNTFLKTLRVYIILISYEAKFEMKRGIQGDTGIMFRAAKFCSLKYIWKPQSEWERQ